MANVIQVEEIENGYMQLLEDYLTDGSVVYEIRVINTNDKCLITFHCITKASGELLWNGLVNYSAAKIEKRFSTI